MNIKHRLEDRYRMGKMEAAAVILADVAKYGGEGSLLVKLSRMAMEGTPANNSLEEGREGDQTPLNRQLQGSKTEVECKRGPNGFQPVRTSDRHVGKHDAGFNRFTISAIRKSPESHSLAVSLNLAGDTNGPQ